MGNPRTPTRNLIAKIAKDQRSIIALEQLFNIVQTDLGPVNNAIKILKELVQEAKIESGEGIARAQQALDALFRDKNHGAFFDTTDQAAVAINTPKAVTFNNTQISKGISVSGSQISIAKTGTYKIEVRMQL